MNYAEKAEYFRKKADEARDRVDESFDRCDTDGFISQHCNGLSSQRFRLESSIAENGGTDTFWGLFDADGRRLKAKKIETRNSFSGRMEMVWVVETTSGRPLWIPAFKDTARSKRAKYGFVEKMERAPAKAVYRGGNGRGFSGLGNVQAVSIRLDKGYPKDAILYDDNGDV